MNNNNSNIIFTGIKISLRGQQEELRKDFEVRRNDESCVIRLNNERYQF